LWTRSYSRNRSAFNWYELNKTAYTPLF
jgi:hypothetical protein